MLSGVDPVSSSRSIALAAGKGIATQDVLSTWVLVPMMVNVCALEAGTVLKRYMPSLPGDTKSKDPKAITIVQVAKRVKLSA